MYMFRLVLQSIASSILPRKNRPNPSLTEYRRRAAVEAAHVVVVVVVVVAAAVVVAAVVPSDVVVPGGAAQIVVAASFVRRTASTRHTARMNQPTPQLLQG
jgi:Flp pilus assembly protein TadB